MGEPRAFWKWMLWCTEIPRPSGHTELMRQRLKEAAAQLGLEYFEDKVHNVKLVKKATPGYENAPTVCLQAHQDIVAAHDPALRPVYDPTKDPVFPYVKDGYLCSQGSTLGADDGMGIATCMYILESKDIPHGKIEFLCTDDEEVGTSGAQGLEASFFCPKTKYIINVDSEEENALCLGSAGGANITLHMPLARETCRIVTVPLVVSVSGLSGGHSGSDIHLYKANAFKVVARLLLAAWDTEFVMEHLEGGSARNAIPRRAAATVVVPAANKEKFISAVQQAAKIMDAEYATHELHGIGAVVRDADAERPLGTPLTRTCTRAVLNLWKLIPCNPLRMSAEISGLVESSSAATLCTMKTDAMDILSLARTSRDSQWHDIEQQMQALADFVGGTMTVANKYPGWLPLPSSTLSQIAQSTHQELFGKQCRVYAVHAGLECGIFLKKLPHCEAISIGPQVEHAHSCSECCLISSGPALVRWVTCILEKLSK
eukprot:TRINITY_DN2158_c1_g1_i1.p1 TRINITY_DN2158_c1_g1~~TRINITY_DN2158_c1_g1_i1.p1  ORF type:complete len:523 (-),score=141.90 TRINITY_DN2158_c1_g1_i1:56-1516(-)